MQVRPLRQIATLLLAAALGLPLLTSSCGSGAQDPRLLEREAARLMEAEEWREVVDVTDQLLEIDPNSVAGHVMRAGALSELNRLEEALRAQQTAYELEPNNFQILYDLGRYQFELQRFAKALESYTRCVELNPEFVEGQTNRAVTLARLGRAEEAAEAFKKALEVKPDHATALDGLARVEAHLAAQANGDGE